MAVEHLTVSATPSGILNPPPPDPLAFPFRGVVNPRRRIYAATFLAVVLGGLAVVAVIARDEEVPSGAMDRRVVLPVPAGLPAMREVSAVAMASALAAPTGPAKLASSASSANSIDGGVGGVTDAGVARAGLVHVIAAEAVRSPLPRSADGMPFRSLSYRERGRVTRTGELAILVKPWAVIWLNGKRSGQTPFRATVPAGRYQIRLSNDDVGMDETMAITVEPDKTATIERSW